MKTLGDDISALLCGAQDSALIVAPFMRSEALSRLLDSIPVGTQTTIVTRWRPVDLLAGASDLGVYDLAESKKIPLYLRQDLHAKFFAADAKCLIGSANVTLTALGWRTPANLELLAPVARTASHIVEFEKMLLSGSVRATAEQRDRLEELLGRLRRSSTVASEIDYEMIGGLLPPNWVPRVRNPEELYSAYRGDNDITRTTLSTIQEDLRQIGAIPGMDKDGFRAWVAATINQAPLVRRVIQCIEEKGEVTESVLKDLLAEIGADIDEFRPRDVLEVLERWLTYFLPEQYETARDSIKLIKAKKV